jgi:hypothetical protein
MYPFRVSVDIRCKVLFHQFPIPVEYLECRGYIRQASFYKDLSGFHLEFRQFKSNVFLFP